MKVKESTNCSDYESAGHAVQYFLDSFETTSISNAFVMYELAKYKRAQNKLRDEIVSAKDLSFDELDKLPYLEQCIYEALRLNPPLHHLSRLCTEPIESKMAKESKLILMMVSTFQFITFITIQNIMKIHKCSIQNDLTVESKHS